MEILLSGLDRFEYSYRVLDANVNQGQMTTDFDEQFEQAVLARGASAYRFEIPADIPQQLDFAFRYENNVVAVEIEKKNREKILRDILKAHMYLELGADYALIVLSKNYPHRHGIWNLYEFGVQRLSECWNYGFGTEDKLGRVLLLGFEQFDSKTDKPLDEYWRNNIRQLNRGQADRHQPGRKPLK